MSLPSSVKEIKYHLYRCRAIGWSQLAAWKLVLCPIVVVIKSGHSTWLSQPKWQIWWNINLILEVNIPCRSCPYSDLNMVCLIGKCIYYYRNYDSQLNLSRKRRSTWTPAVRGNVKIPTYRPHTNHKRSSVRSHTLAPTTICDFSHSLCWSPLTDLGHISSVTYVCHPLWFVCGHRKGILTSPLMNIG